MLIWNGSVSLYGDIFKKFQKRAVLRVGKDLIEAGTPIPAGSLTAERIDDLKKRGMIKNVAPDVIADDEPEEIQEAPVVADKPKRGRRAGVKSEVSDVDAGSQG